MINSISIPTKLAKFGWFGIAIAGLMVILALAGMNWKMAGNHIEHSTEAMVEVAGNLKENTEVLRSLKSSTDMLMMRLD